MKKVIVVLTVLLIFLIGFLIINHNKYYSRNLFYMDTYIDIKIKAKNKNQADKVLDKVDNIFHEYHMLTDRYNGYIGLINVYEINNTKKKDKSLKIDKKLYDLIDYGLKLKSKTNNLLDINIGYAVDVWKKYREKGEGIPKLSELQSNTNDIVLLENNTIKNNHPNIDLGSITKGYVTKLVGDYLKSEKIEDFIINAGGNVLVGNKTNGYKIGVKSPNDNGIFKVLKANDVAVVTSGSYERYYKYNGKLYHHIIDPVSLFPPNYMKSVTVICKDSSLADSLSTTLFLMSIDDGKEFIKKYQDVNVIWYSNDDKVITTEGISKYE